MNLLILGAGASCQVIIEELQAKLEKVYVYDVSSVALEKVKQKYPSVVETISSPEELKKIAEKDFDFVIEVASREAVQEWLPFFLKKGKKVIVLSIGVFSDPEFRSKVQDILKTSSGNLIIPHGAVGGFDVIKALSGRIQKVRLQTRKPPHSLGKDVETATIVFSGTASEAIEAFPKNINVAVALSFLLGDFSLLKVEIVADPSVKRNIHELTVESNAGNYFFRFENFPSFNPKTSLLAPLSIVGYLKSSLKNISFGG
jgi:aspartate dehydrogenase